MAGIKQRKRMKSKIAVWLSRAIAEMKKIPKVNTVIEISLAYAEGKQAFDENRRRGYNPYTVSNQGLAMDWWHGWDTAEEESFMNQPNSEV